MTPQPMHWNRGFIPLPAIVGCIFLLWAMPVAAVELPGSLAKDADCSACHMKKMIGKSVHSVMSSPCTVCHLTATQGDMTTTSLSMPKAKICFACHEQATASSLHDPAVKGQCLECHDAHSSGGRMLLREEGGVPWSALRTK